MNSPAAFHFADRLLTAIERRGTAAIVGIDPVLEKLPESLRPRETSAAAAAGAIEAFSREIIDVVAPVVPAVKINSAFFEAFYEAGVAAFFRVIEHAHRAGLLVISDVKRGDIGTTAALYARGHLDSPRFADVAPARVPDAVTLAGYLGENAVRPFIDSAAGNGRGLFVLVRPSDPGADATHEFGGATKFYQHMGNLVREWGEPVELIGAREFSLVGAVVAPKDAASTKSLREALPRTLFLVPGYGAQGGTADRCAACFRPDGFGAVVNASRSVIFAFSEPRYAERGGDDWRRSVEAAARDFAADIARIAKPNARG